MGAERKRKQVQTIIDATLAAVDPAAALLRHLTLHGDQLHLAPSRASRGAGRHYDLTRYQEITVIGAGKASAPMALAVEQLLGKRIAAGLVLVKHGYTVPTGRVRLIEAGHPVPDRAGLDGAREIIALAQRAGPDDLVIALISGGASALLTAPVPAITLADLQATTGALLRCGATINEINTVRKHLSRVMGGQLARLVAPATLLTLVVSDVVGSPLDIIGSGPTVPDPSTFADALAIVARYSLADQLPPPVLAHLRHGAPETPKPGDPLFERVQTEIIASNELAAAAALDKARELGFNTLLLSTYIEGEARQVGRVVAAIAKELRHHGRPLAPPACIVAGGETTVTVRGSGRGGRNQELALAASIPLDGLENLAIISLATDGTDGPTDAAGAWIDGSTVQRGRALGLSAADYMANNDSYHYLSQLGDLIITGPTNTNVNDIILIFIW